MIEESEPLYADPRFWVAVAFVGFFAFFGKMLWKALAGALDNRSAQIKAELDETRRLREEAETLLIAYRKKYKESAQEAATMLAHAREEAATFTTQAQAELKALLDARTRLAEEKIAQAEQQVMDEVRQRMADITIAATHTLISSQLDRLPDDAPVSAAVANLKQKMH